MIVGPTKALFMDEITNGLDSSTAFQIVSCIQQLVHITNATALIALLQPAPETFDLFDDVILMAEGKIVYHGPRDCVLQFFEDCGFRCPSRKGVADFLQEVMRQVLYLIVQIYHQEVMSIYQLQSQTFFAIFNRLFQERTSNSTGFVRTLTAMSPQICSMIN